MQHSRPHKHSMAQDLHQAARRRRAPSSGKSAGTLNMAKVGGVFGRWKRPLADGSDETYGSYLWRMGLTSC